MTNQVKTFNLSAESASALCAAAKSGEISIDKWRNAADALYADGVRWADVSEKDAGFRPDVFAAVRTAIINGMKGERTKFLLSVESKQLTSGDDKDLRKMAENRLKEHLRSVRKYLKSHEEAEAKGPTELKMLSEKVLALLQSGLELLSKDHSDKVKDIDIPLCMAAFRTAKDAVKAATLNK